MTITIPVQPTALDKKALMWSIGVHLLLLLLFFLLHYNVPQPQPIAEGGLEVNLGNSETGSGTDQPMSRKDPAEYQASVVYKARSAAAKTVVTDKVYKADNADATALAEKNKKPVIGDSGLAAIKPAQPKYMYPGAKGAGGNSAADDKKGTSEGIAGGVGDQGVPGGTPGAANYTGTPGSGGGITHTLTGRKITPNKFVAEFSEGGKVVIRVTVDRDGRIVGKTVKSATSAQLAKIALEKLADAKFSKSTGTEPQQFGDVTFEFKTKQ